MGPELAESFGVPGGKGVIVTDVVEGGPAARAGLHAGDVIVSFEGEPMAESYRLRWLTANAGPRRTVRMGVWREGRLHEVRVTLAEKPGTPPPEPLAQTPPRTVAEPFGLSLDDPEQKGSGVRVAAVDLRGDGYRAGIREGDILLEVDGHPVHDRAEVRRVLAGSASPVARLYVRRGSRAIYFGLRRSAPAAAPRLDGAQVAAPR
jgi:S1-C subfamily serine protease